MSVIAHGSGHNETKHDTTDIQQRREFRIKMGLNGFIPMGFTRGYNLEMMMYCISIKRTNGHLMNDKLLSETLFTENGPR